MSKKVRLPSGYVATVSDKVAAILATRPGHTVLSERPADPVRPAKPATKTTEEK